MPVATCIVDATDLDVHAHLALEDALLEGGLAPGARVLMLWRSADCVVLGKNQNAWRETNPARLAADGVVLARRSSGGGAVWHDPGNLNVSVFLPRAEYDADQVAAMMLAGVRAAGVEAAYLGPRHVLMLGERKFSGNAFAYKRSWVLHHGTLLVHADLPRLGRYLEPALPEAALQTRAIASVRAAVMNLAEARPGLRCEALLEPLGAAFRSDLAAAAPTCPRLDATALLAAHPELAAAVAEALPRHRSWAWQCGHTPAFDAIIGDDPASQVRLSLRQGLVERVALPDTPPPATPATPSTTAPNCEQTPLPSLDRAWRGCRFSASALLAAAAPLAASPTAPGAASPAASPAVDPASAQRLAPLLQWLHHHPF